MGTNSGFCWPEVTKEKSFSKAKGIKRRKSLWTNVSELLNVSVAQIPIVVKFLRNFYYTNNLLIRKIKIIFLKNLLRYTFHNKCLTMLLIKMSLRSAWIDTLLFSGNPFFARRTYIQAIYVTFYQLSHPTLSGDLI